MAREQKVPERLSRYASHIALCLASEWKLGKKLRALFWRFFEFPSGACQVRVDFAQFFFVLARQNRGARSSTATITLLHLGVHLFFPKRIGKTCGDASQSCQSRAEIFENPPKRCTAEGQNLLRKRLPPSVMGHNVGRPPFDLRAAPTFARTEGRSHFYVKARQAFDGD